jgi:hypothetical protein
LDANPLFNVARVGLLIVSFVCLAQFGQASLATMRNHGPGRWVLAVMVALAALGGLSGLSGLNAAARYGLGFLGGLWAAWALFFAAKTLPLGARQLQAAAWGMVLYALAAGLVPNPAPFFPASWLNYESFLVLTAVPIQLIRCWLAVWVSISLCLLAKSCLEAEKDLRQRAWFRSLIRVIITSLTLLVMGGWFITQHFGDIATREKRADYEQVVEILSQTMQQNVSELERFVALISEWPTTLPALVSGTPKTIDQANFGLDFFCQKLLAEGSILVVPDAWRVKAESHFQLYSQQAKKANSPVTITASGEAMPYVDEGYPRYPPSRTHSVERSSPVAGLRVAKQPGHHPCCRHPQLSMPYAPHPCIPKLHG